MKFDGGLPRAWAESLARLATAQKPGSFEDERWATIVDDAHRLVTGHLARIVSFGWVPSDVKELLPMIKGREIVAVGMGDVTVRMPTGPKARIYLRPRMDSAPKWQEGGRAA